MDISRINGFGYSYLDWEHVKRKQKEPNLSFDDVLKESIDKLKDEDEEWLKGLRAYRKIYHKEHVDDCLRAESEEIQ